MACLYRVKFCVPFLISVFFLVSESCLCERFCMIIGGKCLLIDVYSNKCLYLMMDVAISVVFAPDFFIDIYRGIFSTCASVYPFWRYQRRDVILYA